MNEYLSLANFILPEGMLDWFNPKDVRTTSANGQTTIHIYLDENEKTPVLKEFEKYSMERLMTFCYKHDEQYKFTDTLKALRLTLKHVEDTKYDKELYFIVIIFDKGIVNIKGFDATQTEDATNEYAQEEQSAVESKKAVVLVSVDNIKNLREAYPSYFLDTSEFIDVLEKIRENCVKRGYIQNNEIDITNDNCTKN